MTYESGSEQICGEMGAGARGKGAALEEQQAVQLVHRVSREVSGKTWLKGNGVTQFRAR